VVNIFLKLTTKKDSKQKLIAIRKKKIFQQLELRIAKKARKAKKILKGKTFLFWNFSYCAFSEFHGSLNNNFPKFYFKIFKAQNRV
jgi:hypothetical protein